MGLARATTAGSKMPSADAEWSVYSPLGCRTPRAGFAAVPGAWVSVPPVGQRLRAAHFATATGSEKARVEGYKSGEEEQVLASRKHLWRLWNWVVPSFLFFFFILMFYGSADRQCHK